MTAATAGEQGPPRRVRTIEEIRNSHVLLDRDAMDRHEDPTNWVPAGPAYRTRGPRASRGLSTHVPIRFGAELIAAVKRLADMDSMTVSSWVRVLVTHEIDRRQSRPTNQHVRLTKERAQR